METEPYRRPRNAYVPDRVRRQVEKRSGRRCERCGEKSVYLPLHHKIAVVEGGVSTPENLMQVCEPCHNYLHREQGIYRGKKGKTRRLIEQRPELAPGTVRKLRPKPNVMQPDDPTRLRALESEEGTP